MTRLVALAKRGFGTATYYRCESCDVNFLDKLTPENERLWWGTRNHFLVFPHENKPKKALFPTQEKLNKFRDKL